MSSNFDEWRTNILREYEESRYWKRIGMWGYPTKDNDAHLIGMLTHVCIEAWKHNTDNPQNLEGTNKKYCCRYCKMEAPEGIRMIALLEKL